MVKNVMICALLSIGLFSCFDVERVDVSEIQNELLLTDPMKISDGEMMAMAQHIGDSLFLTVDVQNSTKYDLEKHTVVVASEKDDTLSKSVLGEYYEAFLYQHNTAGKFSSDVKFPRRENYVNYFNAKFDQDSTLKVVGIQINLHDVTVKIAQEREK